MADSLGKAINYSAYCKGSTDKNSIYQNTQDSSEGQQVNHTIQEKTEREVTICRGSLSYFLNIRLKHSVQEARVTSILKESFRFRF